MINDKKYIPLQQVSAIPVPQSMPSPGPLTCHHPILRTSLHSDLFGGPEYKLDRVIHYKNLDTPVKLALE